MRVDERSKSECCGCGACTVACSHNAIKLVPDSLGFNYPVIDNSLCINCGLCYKACQFKKDYFRGDNFDLPIVKALRLTDDKELIKSQSGGAFYALAKQVIKLGGIVYGAAFDAVDSIKHIKVDSIEDLQRLRGSKYVQSSTDGIFQKVKQDLKEGRLVLFSGTACQVAGLKKIITPSLSKNLFLVDIICHGVPSPKIWADNIAYLENKSHSTILKANFRNKRFGWDDAKETYILENGQELVRHTFLDLYFGHLISRDCCKKCYYTNLKRVGDLTIGDFWGWKKYHDVHNDNKGISVILINSEKGKLLIDRCKSDINIYDSNTTECMQSKLKYPAEESYKKNQFLDEYHKKGFSYVLHKYTDEGWRLRTKIFIANLIGYIK